MDRVRFEERKGKRILIVDLSGTRSAEETSIIFKAAREKIDLQPPKSLLLLTDVTGTHYDTQNAEALKAYTKANTPFVKASAAIGVVGIKLILYRAVVKITGRNIATFDNVESGLDWLAEQ